MASNDATVRCACRQEYVGALGEDAATRADALGLDHVGDCTDDDPADGRLRCWRCWFIYDRRTRGTDAAPAADHEDDSRIPK